jgi:tetratricopeptide (TPR) repeat protein
VTNLWPSPERWRQLEPLLDGALALPAEQRAQFLEQTCGADHALRQELAFMISACESREPAHHVLDQPAAEQFASLWQEEEAHDLALLQAALADRYRLEVEAGRGGMAVVYRARDLRHQRPVALKVLRTTLAGAGLARFRREIALTANLQHPHILPVFDSGESDGQLWYTMPFVEGESLGERLRREGRLEMVDALRLLREIADALDYAHARGIVHRDLKPDNVLLSGQHAVIADFGVARALVVATDAGAAGDQGRTALGVSVGTPAYMAPEQAAGDPHVDHRADLYALGVIAYQLITGATPFTGASRQVLLAAHIGQAPVNVSTHRDDVPTQVEQLVMRLLAKDPALRPQSAADVLAELSAASLNAPVATQRIAVRQDGAKRVRRFRPPLLLGAALLVVAVGVVAWYARATTSDLVEQTVLVVPFENQTGDSTLAPLGRIASDWIAQELATIGTLEVSSDLARAPAGGEAGLREAAGTRQAATIVSGIYSLDADSVRFQPSVIDVAGWKLLPGVRAVRAPKSNPTATLDTVAQRVMAVVARARDPNLTGWDLGAPPPTYEAMRQFHNGLDAFVSGNPEGAVPHWERAAQLDSTYALPVLHLIIAYTPLGQDSVANMLLQQLERRRASLTPSDRAMLDLNRAWLEGRHEDYRLAARAMVAATPGAHLPYFFSAIGGIITNRPREALVALQRLPYQYGRWSTGWSAGLRWFLVTSAHHALGEHQDELEAAQTARRLVPDRLDVLALELRALAAAGHTNQIERRLETLENMPPVLGEATIADVFLSLAEELEAHAPGTGRERARRAASARALRQRLLTWLQRRSVEEQGKAESRLAAARAHYVIGQYETADSLLSRFAQDRPPCPSTSFQAGVPSCQVRFQTYKALVAMRRGDTFQAQQIAEHLGTLTGPYNRGAATLARAQISAQLGETEKAIELLDQALRGGVRDIPAIHAQFDLAPLRDHPRFRRLLQPKG